MAFPLRSLRIAAAAAGIAVALMGCIHRFYETRPRSLEIDATRDTAATLIRAPLRAHLADGSLVIFRSGAWIANRSLSGNGEAFTPLGAGPTPRMQVPLDSVLGVEAFESKLLHGPSVAASIAASAAGLFGAVVLAKALFGSCPTLYNEDDEGELLLAEGFSYAIAPLLEHRDLDPLKVRPRADGSLRLELRNEALETHFINHVEVVAVDHAPGARALPDQHGQPVVVGALRGIARATDRAGRDVTRMLAAADGELFSSAAGTVAQARADDLDDWIDVELSGLPPGDSVAVVLRLRNSLLNTVLLYDVILGGRDAPDWLAEGMQRIATAIDLSTWYVQSMGMRVIVEGAAKSAGATEQPHARIGDVGPLAFRDVAIVLPRPTPDASTMRVRLRFVADNWRIDQVQVATAIARPAPRVVPLSRVIVPTPAEGDGPVEDVAAFRALVDADGDYLETRPGQRMLLDFDRAAGNGGVDVETSFLIAWQGWYREWIRGEWLAEPKRTTPFVPGDAAVFDALRRWSEQGPGLERAFYASRVPVR